MRKLKLEIDALVVESFNAAPTEEAARGTVQANALSDAVTCPRVCGGTIEISCLGSCYPNNPYVYC